ncbi:hypothetical protein OIDMADRAFT_15956 [Oidiodendron maius Zn]|uniref:Uncharacterized protein n=1 Tax=Oidiodendron maius (strain Zn) TaxID=913774 RepID=A0A0C3HFB0_OIDMZ|nr:hypothetical protein OIDMADRAFT_15956 [Oidiodendron maius Zn]
MAPLTRSKNRACTPDRPTIRPQYDTIKRTSFFNDYDQWRGKKTLSEIAAINDITDRWSPAYRKQRQRSNKLGRKSRVSDKQCQMLVLPSRNPVKPRQLINRLKQATKEGRRYKIAYVQKEISAKNKRDRVKYGETHKDKTIDDFWSWIMFIDEFHVDPAAIGAAYILQEAGTRTDSENIQERL